MTKQNIAVIEFVFLNQKIVQLVSFENEKTIYPNDSVDFTFNISHFGEKLF